MFLKPEMDQVWSQSADGCEIRMVPVPAAPQRFICVSPVNISAPVCAFVRALSNETVGSNKLFLFTHIKITLDT